MRPTIEAWGLDLAEVVAMRGTCGRRQVGCVLLNAQGHVLATGYNGPARGTPNCGDDVHGTSCHGVGYASGQGLEVCQAVHAEQNALMQCADIGRIATICVTDSPCLHCVKMLMNTGAAKIVFRRPYADHHDVAKRWWVGSSRREWERL